jgi:hypothetical protein
MREHFLRTVVPVPSVTIKVAETFSPFCFGCSSKTGESESRYLYNIFLYFLSKYERLKCTQA